MYISVMNKETGVREAFAVQAEWCLKLNSPLTARLMAGLGHSLDRHTKTGNIVLDWAGPPGAMGDSVPLRLAGALHALVRRGALPELAEFYPPNDLPDAGTLTSAALRAIEDRDTEICAWLKHPPQTNEVGRSAILYPGFMQIAQETGLPLALFEVGCSAGLNLNADRYRYRFGAISFGQSNSGVVLSPQWQGSPPGGADPVIRSRRGCDRNPFDIQDAEQAERLIAYVWPDQPERMARISAACKIGRQHPPGIDKADAADWVDQMFGAPAEQGVARVLFHSIAFQYFPEESQRRITARLREAGAQATAEAPVAWLGYEHRKGRIPELTLRLWPGKGEARTLATGDAHCREIIWTG